MDTVSERQIRGDGTAPARWEPWLSSNVPRWAPAVRAAAGRLVVVAPHPDDELLMCGGLLQRHLSRGGDALLMAVTDGEASHRGVEDMPVEALRTTRKNESRQGLAQLGLTEPPVIRLELPDGEVSAHAAVLREALARTLQPEDMVVTTWRLDGHPDHEATGEAVAAACAAVGCQLLEAPVWMWHWAAPGHEAVPAARIHALDLSPVEVATKMRALECHRSQWNARSTSLPPVLDRSVLHRSTWPSEYFFIAGRA